MNCGSQQNAIGGSTRDTMQKIETKSMHITPIGGNVFADLGFKQEEALFLQAESKRIISEKFIIKERLMSELSDSIGKKT